MLLSATRERMAKKLFHFRFACLRLLPNSTIKTKTFLFYSRVVWRSQFVENSFRGGCSLTARVGRPEKLLFILTTNKFVPRTTKIFIGILLRIIIIRFVSSIERSTVQSVEDDFSLPCKHDWTAREVNTNWTRRYKQTVLLPFAKSSASLSCILPLFSSLVLCVIAL